MTPLVCTLKKHKKEGQVQIGKPPPFEPPPPSTGPMRKLEAVLWCLKYLPPGIFKGIP